MRYGKASLYSKEPSVGIIPVLVNAWTDSGVWVTMVDTGEDRFYPYTSFYRLSFWGGAK